MEFFDQEIDWLDLSAYGLRLDFVKLPTGTQVFVVRRRSGVRDAHEALIDPIRDALTRHGFEPHSSGLCFRVAHGPPSGLFAAPWRASTPEKLETVHRTMADQFGAYAARLRDSLADHLPEAVVRRMALRDVFVDISAPGWAPSAGDEAPSSPRLH